jgi:hypothetical protein
MVVVQQRLGIFNEDELETTRHWSHLLKNSTFNIKIGALCFKACTRHNIWARMLQKPLMEISVQFWFRLEDSVYLENLFRIFAESYKCVYIYRSLLEAPMLHLNLKV